MRSLRSNLLHCLQRRRLCGQLHATFATISTRPVPHTLPPPSPPPVTALSGLDDLLLSSFATGQTSIHALLRQYKEYAGRVLTTELAQESRPPPHRRINFEESSGVLLVAHCAQDPTTRARHVSLASGFAVRDKTGEDFIVTCAHTLEEIRRSPLLSSDGAGTLLSGSFVVTMSPEADDLVLIPVLGIESSLPRSDLLLLSVPPSSVRMALRTLPVSPYPALRNTSLRAHFLCDDPIRGEWRHCQVLGYKDSGGSEAEPGTYDALSHMFFSALPTSGSSGGPIVEEESGAVVGVILGSRMDNRVEGTRGWGVPAEALYEMFKLPGVTVRAS